MNLLDYAKAELKIAGLLDSKDESQQAINKHILELIEKFAEEGHSGNSADYTISILTKLLKYKPLSPLTGEAHEWIKTSDDLWQNKRCFSVFKNKKDEAYDLDGNIFENQNGVSFTCQYSRIPVKFPYYPKELNIIKIFEFEEKENKQSN